MEQDPKLAEPLEEDKKLLENPLIIQAVNETRMQGMRQDEDYGGSLLIRKRRDEEARHRVLWACREAKELYLKRKEKQLDEKTVREQMLNYFMPHGIPDHLAKEIIETLIVGK